MVDKEMLAAMSEMMDQKLDQKLDTKLRPIYDRLDKLEVDMKYVRVVQLENNVILYFNTIEKCYLDASKRFVERTEQIDAMGADIKVIQGVLVDHSQRLSKILV